jgi:hypothetical protein
MAVKDLLIRLGVRGEKKAAKSIKGVDKSFKSMASSAMKIGAAFYAAKGLVSGLKEIAEVSGKMESVGAGFENLAKQSGFAGDTLGKLQKATDGTVSSLDLMTQANNAMLLGIFESEDQMASMFDSAQRLAGALGQDTLFGVESLVTGLGRQSKLMLDNLGIMVDAEKANTKYAASLGISADKLDDAQRKQAFINEALEQADTLVASLGEEQLTTADKMDMLKSSTTNMAGVLGKALTPAFDASLDMMTDFAGGISGIVGSLEKIDLTATGKNIMKNIEGLLQAIKSTFTLTFDFLPDAFRFAFGKIAPIAGAIFERVGQAISDAAVLLWEPIVIYARLTAINAQNAFIVMFNNIKELFNSLADSWIGEKMGVEQLTMTDFIDTEGIKAELGETGLAKLFGGDDQVQNLTDFTDKTAAVWATYFETVAVMKDENNLIEGEKTTEQNEAALANQRAFLDQGLTLQEASDNAAMVSIMKKAQAHRDANVSEVEVQKFITKEKQKLRDIENKGDLDRTSTALGLMAQVGSARKADGMVMKTIASGEAIVNTYRAANDAFQQFGGYPAGVIPAALSVALGLANVAEIASVKFASGGIVPGTNVGGGDTVPAMLTPGELILNQAQQNSLSKGMGGVTINFTGPITNDDYVKDFIIPEISRALDQNLA